MTNSFNDLGLNLNLIQGLEKQNIIEPTDIQIKTIPLALENKDIIGESETGSGKTLAYLLPIFQKIDSSKKDAQAIILAPTHELVMQINNQIKLLAENSGIPIRSYTIMGEVNIKRQLEHLKEKPHIIVGSTGRILEIIKMRKLNTQTVKTIIIDEGDKLLSDSTLNSVRDVIKTTMRDRQLMVFSATINDRAINVAKELMKDAEVVKIETKAIVNPNITHIYFIAEQRDKLEILRKVVASINPKKAIVFINNSDKVQTTALKLQYHNIKTYALYGNASKESRKNALEDFRKGNLQLLVASDMASRGLDIQDLTHIINLDLPENLNEYLHRAGRTGRAGKLGTVISIVTKSEEAIIRRLQKEFSIKIDAKEMSSGNIVDKGCVKTNPPKGNFKKNVTLKKNSFKKK